MKEKIYTILLVDGFNNKKVCPFCFIEDLLEREMIDYTLGASMMEPDVRENTNKTGFCKIHLNMMLKENKKLPLALMLSTHMDYVKNQVADIKLNEPKGGLFKKKTEKSETENLKSCMDSCIICKKIEYDMKRYIDVFSHMWQKEEEFRSNVSDCKNLCVHHGLKVLESSDNLTYDLKKEIIRLMDISLEENITQVRAFIDMFDYRAPKGDPSAHKDATSGGINVLRGSINNL